jgi:hypothetical protein
MLGAWSPSPQSKPNQRRELSPASFDPRLHGASALQTVRFRTLKQRPRFAVIYLRSVAMPSKNERVELEMRILKARQLARTADDLTRERLEALAAELEQKLREIDE